MTAPADGGANAPATARSEVDASAVAAPQAEAGTMPAGSNGYACDPTLAKAAGTPAPAANEAELAPHAMLVVDELGRLELLRGCGLTNAPAILDAGPTPQFPHAIAVVRETLLDKARRRFEPRWGKATVIGPDDAARNLVLETARAAGGAH